MQNTDNKILNKCLFTFYGSCFFIQSVKTNEIPWINYLLARIIYRQLLSGTKMMLFYSIFTQPVPNHQTWLLSPSSHVQISS